MSGARLALRAARSSLVVALALFATSAQAESPADSTPEKLDRAAATFDAGVKAFEESDFEVAARRFLRADALVPNTDALHNALMAAERAQHEALVATAAERVTSREASSRELMARAKKTLAEVRDRVARLVLSCRPIPCELALDGEDAAPGATYALPGARLVTARFSDGSLAERRIEAVAGGEQTIVVELESHVSPFVAGLQAPAFTPEPNQRISGGPMKRPTDGERPLSPPVVYVGAGITLALAAATAWSGIDTLKAKNRLPGTQSDNDDVMARAHRTDALLIGTVLAGVATTTVGLVWTDWDGAGSEVALGGSLGERGALLIVRATH